MQNTAKGQLFRNGFWGFANCFCSFFGGNRRPQKTISKLTDLYYVHSSLVEEFQINWLDLTTLLNRNTFVGIFCSEPYLIIIN